MNDSGNETEAEIKKKIRTIIRACLDDGGDYDLEMDEELSRKIPLQHRIPKRIHGRDSK